VHILIRLCQKVFLNAYAVLYSKPISSIVAIEQLWWANRSGSLLILSLYNILICLVAAALYVAVNKLEPNRSHASALKILIITLAVVAILAHSMQWPECERVSEVCLSCAPRAYQLL
jgi:hypothetical protein